jgi:hypothetical protein
MKTNQLQRLIVSLLTAATKLATYAQTLQADKLKLAEELAMALSDDAADQATIDAANAKVAELEAIVDAGVGVDSEDEAALAASIESIIPADLPSAV